MKESILLILIFSLFHQKNLLIIHIKFLLSEIHLG